MPAYVIQADEFARMKVIRSTGMVVGLISHRAGSYPFDLGIDITTALARAKCHPASPA